MKTILALLILCLTASIAEAQCPNGRCSPQYGRPQFSWGVGVNVAPQFQYAAPQYYRSAPVAPQVYYYNAQPACTNPQCQCVIRYGYCPCGAGCRCSGNSYRRCRCRCR